MSETAIPGTMEVSQIELLICFTCISNIREELVVNTIVKQPSTTEEKLDSISMTPLSFSKQHFGTIK